MGSGAWRRASQDLVLFAGAPALENREDRGSLGGGGFDEHPKKG